jgi:hypothetical protein
MSEGTVRQWCRMFKAGQANKCSQWRVKWSVSHCSHCSHCSDDLVKSVDQKILWKLELHNYRTFVWISSNFTHCSLWDYHSLARLSQVLPKMGFENAHWCAQNAENGFSFGFFYSDTTKMAMNFSVTLYDWQAMKPGFHLWMLEPKSSQSSGCTHIHQTSR